jgi:hypothetical protein
MAKVDLYEVCLSVMSDTMYQRIQQLSRNGKEVLLHEHVQDTACEGQAHWYYYKHKAIGTYGLPQASKDTALFRES